VVALDPHAIIVGVVVLVMSVGVMMVTDNRCSIGETFDGHDYRIKTELLEDRDLRRPLHRESTCSVRPVAMLAVEVEVEVGVPGARADLSSTSVFVRSCDG
jgi:hypothetical protein